MCLCYWEGWGRGPGHRHKRLDRSSRREGGGHGDPGLGVMTGVSRRSLLIASVFSVRKVTS